MRLVRSFSFRLAAIYFILFSVSLAVLLGTYHWVSIKAPRDQVRESLVLESDRFSAAYKGDSRALAASLERRAGEPTSRAGFHLLTDPRGGVVTTNLPSWPRFTGTKWHSIEADIYRDGDEDDHEALAYDRLLSDGSRLLIGRDVEELDDLEEAIVGAARYLIVATLLLAITGAFLMNRAIGRRLAAVSGTARQVIGGDLSGRVPMNGSGDDFDRLAATINLMLDRVASGVESVRRVSDVVAHELRTPLARLQAHLRSMEGEGPAMKSALAEAEQLQAIFDAILRIARIESGRHSADFAPVDLTALLTDAGELYAPSAEERNIALEIGVEDGLAVPGDRDLLFQALSNLLDNAIKFTPPGGSVRLRGSRLNDRIQIEVSDSGPGVAPEEKSMLGERFYRASSGEGVPGYGLGLSLVSAVATLHGSEISFPDSGPGLTVVWSLRSQS